MDSNYGTQIWNYEIPGGVFSSPCLVGDDGMTVVVGSMDKFIYAIEIKSGNILWTFETGGEVWSSPSYNGNEIFIGSDDGFLYCLDIDGKLIWKTKLNGKIRSSSPCLSFDDESSHSLFLGTYNGGMLLDSTFYFKGKEKSLKKTIFELILKPRRDRERRFIDLPNAFFLYGPPGTGKTKLTKDISFFLGWSFVLVDTATLLKL
ncbi:MAG: PQQ-binding-like beta-propeller repeat protein [Candidatus Nitrosopolaris sp.]